MKQAIKGTVLALVWLVIFYIITIGLIIPAVQALIDLTPGLGF